MPEEKFTKISVKGDVKREIDIIAASERRFVYEVIDDMLKLYKHVAMGKPIRSRNAKNAKTISVSDVIATN